MPRRSVEDRIKQLEAQIQSIKQRAERKKVRKDPAIRHMKAAHRSIEKAINATDDAVLKQSLSEAALTISSSLSLLGITVRGGSRGALNPRPRRARAAASSNGHAFELDVDVVVKHLEANPGQRSEQIAGALGTDTATLRPMLKELMAEGKVKTKGERRATAYSLVGA